MIQIKYWTKNPSGQVLLATLLFCFIFAALFVGLYKSGLLYNAKTRAIRASNLTALSAGAVYANGLQLVRATNIVLLSAAAVDFMLLTSAEALTWGAASFLPSSVKFALIKGVQSIQRALFGIDQPLAVYPILIFQETLSIASQNGLKNTWPLPSSPILLFNIKSLDGDITQAIVPNMALKFRTADAL